MTRRTRLTSINSRITIEQLKDYLRYWGQSRDNELEMALRSAVTKIEDKKDISLSEMTIQLETNSGIDGKVDLYHKPILEIEQVTDAKGKSLAYEVNSTMTWIITTPDTDVVVRYKTGVAGDIDMVRTAVLATAALIFEGETDQDMFRSVYRNYL